MVDAITPASAVAPSSAVASASNNTIVVDASVNQAPDKIAQLNRQIEVSGTLARVPTASTITLNTPIGPLTLTLPEIPAAEQAKLDQQLLAIFQNQKPLTVVLQPGNPPTDAFLLLPAPSSSAAQNAGLTDTLPLASEASTALQPPPLSLDADLVLSAVVLPLEEAVVAAAANANPETSALVTNLLTTEEGAAPAANFSSSAILLEAQSAAVGTPASATADVPSPPPHQPNQAIPLTGGSATPPPFTPGASNNLPAQSIPLLQPGTELTLHIDAVIDPNAPIPALASNQVLATVTAESPQGQIILKAGDASLFVRQAIDAPIGTQLLLSISETPGRTPAILSPPDHLAFANLQEIFAALQQIDPSAASALLAARMPQPGSNMAGALLFFLSAVRQGDMGAWLGSDAFESLTRAGKAALIGKLIEDLQQTSATFRDPIVGDWKSYPTPIFNNGQFGIIHFYVHNERQRRQDTAKDGTDGGSASPSQVRFLIDVRMSRLGPLQLDGFLRPKQLDIIIRSENKLGSSLDQELRQAYTQSLEAIGYNGSLTFQFGRQGWLSPHTDGGGAAIVT